MDEYSTFLLKVTTVWVFCHGVEQIQPKKKKKKNQKSAVWEDRGDFGSDFEHPK